MPKEEDTIVKISSKESMRLLFAGMPLLSNEQKQMKNFRNYIKEKNVLLPSW